MRRLIACSQKYPKACRARNYFTSFSDSQIAVHSPPLYMLRLLSVPAVQGKSLQSALSDGAKRLQEGPFKGPSAALDNMSAAARDLKEKVTFELIP